MTLRSELRRIGFNCSKSDPGVFTISKGSARLILLAYVDDLIIADNDAELRKEVMSNIHAKWETTDITELEWCLGTKIERDRPRWVITMDQSLYIKTTVKRFGSHPLTSNNRTHTPCGEGIKNLEKAPPA